MISKIYSFLSSAKLAIALLVIILACCVAGVTIWRGVEAGRVIFGTLWFNGLLVLLVVNVACCFFGRIWGRKVTVVSAGMMLFQGVGSGGQGLESVCYSSSTGKIYFGAKYNALGCLSIVELNPSTLEYTLHVMESPNYVGADLFVIATDGTYIYGANDTVFFKIRISDWTLIQTQDFTSSGFADSHGIGINTSRNQLYVTSQYDVSMLAIVNINDLSDYTTVSLASYVSHPTDDMTFYDDGDLCRVFVVGEYNVTGYGGAYVDITDSNAVTGIDMTPSYGLWVHEKCVYSAGIPDVIEVFSVEAARRQFRR